MNLTLKNHLQQSDTPDLRADENVMKCVCVLVITEGLFFPPHIYTPFFILFKSRLIYELSSLLLLLCCYRHLLLPFCDFTILIIIIVILITLALEILAPMVKSGKKTQQYLIQFRDKNNTVTYEQCISEVCSHLYMYLFYLSFASVHI